MLTNTQWYALCKAKKHLNEEIGKVFFYDKIGEYVEITHYTLSGQMFYTNQDNSIRGFIWDNEYFEKYKGEN
jgi:hypothetical protein